MCAVQEIRTWTGCHRRNRCRNSDPFNRGHHHHHVEAQSLLLRSPFDPHYAWSRSCYRESHTRACRRRLSTNGSSEPDDQVTTVTASYLPTTSTDWRASYDDGNNICSGSRSHRATSNKLMMTPTNSTRLPLRACGRNCELFIFILSPSLSGLRRDRPSVGFVRRLARPRARLLRVTRDAHVFLIV